jgi:hypothetical protein
MAPEMVIMLTQSRHEKKGYSNSVDWWSLGATMFKLATVSAVVDATYVHT